MTVGALAAGMRPCQRVTRKLMVEFILIEPDDLEIDSMMVAVAFCAIVSFNLCRSMITQVEVDARFQLRMAGKALVVRYLVAEGVALGAVTDSFKMCMNGSKLARRDLTGTKQRQ